MIRYERHKHTPYQKFPLLLLVSLLASVRANPFFGYNYEKPACPIVPPEIVYTTIWEQSELETIYIPASYPVQVPVYETVTQTLTVQSPPQVVYQTVTLPPQILPAQTVYNEVTKTVCSSAPRNEYLPPPPVDAYLPPEEK
ncbi:uncharacterized protein LOC119766397 [Culex quinquefasciatus]|uniref:uncharacterized protein LOC119766397 n=1 Tax=Culex quinquefasciatus TaxID=7176 RepID=UPI0018E36278|nr:uncharacterized protein LOC119766397 [Culex quinquefasciatus]